MPDAHERVGVVRTGSVLDEVVQEMLDHQGIFYEFVERENHRTYPSVLVATSGDNALATARSSCASHEGVIVVDRTIDLRRALHCLMGLEDRRQDRLQLEVNEWETKLLSQISDTISAAGAHLVRKRFWPGNAIACCVMTSDVDWLTYSPLHGAVLKGGSHPGRLIRLLYGLLSRRNFGLNFDELVGAQAKHEYRSTVFLRSSYESGRENLAEAVSKLKDANFEIGLHGSDGAHTSLGSLVSELEVISSIAGVRPKGVRHHILKMHIPETWEIESSAGLSYDATLSYNRFFGFRSEICFPYHPFGKNRLGLLELPTSFMDWTALKRGLRGESADEMLSSIMEKVEHYHGLLMVNFHNTYLNRQTFPDILGLYERLIDRVSKRGYWVATASECSDWWNRRAAAKDGGVEQTVGDLLLEAIEPKGLSS